MLLNQASNKTHRERERERERAYCPLHFHTRFDEHRKHICIGKKETQHFGNGTKLLHLTDCNLGLLVSTLGGRHQSKHSLTV